MNLEGIVNFEMKIVEFDTIDAIQENGREQHFIDKYKTKAPNGYNKARGGGGLLKKNDTTIKKHSQASRASWARPEVKANASASQKAANARPSTKANKSASFKIAQNRPEVSERRNAIVRSVEHQTQRCKATRENRMTRRLAIAQAVECIPTPRGIRLQGAVYALPDGSVWRVRNARGEIKRLC